MTTSETTSIDACKLWRVAAIIGPTENTELWSNVMNKSYYETVDKLEKMGVDRDYILGWVGGYLENPEREEQRVTDAYEAGYEDGKNQVTDNAENFKSQ